MLIDQNRQLLRFFRSLPEDQPWVLTERFWEEYQALRVAAGWGRTAVDRKTVRLIRHADEVRLNQGLVCNLANPPENFAFALISAFVFSDANNGAFALAWEPLNQPIRPLSPSEQYAVEMAFNETSEVVPVEGKPEGFWYETPSYQIAGEIRATPAAPLTVSLALHGLTEDLAAEVMGLVKKRLG